MKSPSNSEDARRVRVGGGRVASNADNRLLFTYANWGLLIEFVPAAAINPTMIRQMMKHIRSLHRGGTTVLLAVLLLARDGLSASPSEA